MYTFSVNMPSEVDEQERSYLVDTSAVSVQGQNKTNNEDLVFHRTSQMPNGQPLALLVVCDGMGGYQVGSFASELATHVVTHEIGKLFPHKDYLHAQIEQPTIPRASKLRAWLMETVQEANRLIFEYTNNRPEITHSGTRLTLALIHGLNVNIAHVGDTRAYLWRSHELTQITEDHSIAAELEKGGVLEPSEFLHHPLRKIISRSVGTQPEVNPEIYSLSLWPGDKLLLCSDGLWAAFEGENGLGDLLENDLPASDLCAMLVGEARVRNRQDDVSAALACVTLPTQ